MIDIIYTVLNKNKLSIRNDAIVGDTNDTRKEKKKITRQNDIKRNVVKNNLEKSEERKVGRKEKLRRFVP